MPVNAPFYLTEMHPIPSRAGSTSQDIGSGTRAIGEPAGSPRAARKTLPGAARVTPSVTPDKEIDILGRKRGERHDAESQHNRAAGTLSSAARRGRLPRCHRHDWSGRFASPAMAANPGTYSVPPLTAYCETELEQFTLNVWRTPEVICTAHRADEIAQLSRDSRPANRLA